MANPCGGPTRINSQSQRTIGPIAIQHVLRYRGQQFKVQPVRVSLDLFTTLGFNPRHFVEGATILAMEPPEYRRFCEASGLVKAAGIYPLSMNGDMEAVQRGDIPYLPARSRNLVLPTDHETITLAHEMLHDIFVGGGLSPAERQKFTSEVLHGYRLSVDPNMPHQHKNQAFFQKVARACAERYSLETVEPRYNLGRPERDPGFRLFVGECFAYVGEFMMHPRESQIDSIPDILLRHFKFIRIFDRNAYLAANGQA